MFADDALKIIFSHPAATVGIGGLVGGGGALVYNAVSKPTLDEYGNPIESNDINPFVAAGIGSGIGLVGGMGMNYLKGRNPVQSSQAGRQTPQEVVVNEVSSSINTPMVQTHVDVPYRQDYIQGVDDFRGAAIPIRSNRQPSPTVMPNPQLPSGFQEPTPQQRVIAAKQQMQSDGWDFDKNYWNADNVYKKRNMDMGDEVGSPVIGWDVVEPSMLGKTNNYVVGRGMVKDVYYPDEEYLYSVIDGKQFKDPNKLPQLIQTPPPKFQEEFVTTRIPLANNPTGWNVVSADPEAARYQKWLESEAIIRGQNQRPQVIGDNLFDADGNMIFDYPQKKIV